MSNHTPGPWFVGETWKLRPPIYCNTGEICTTEHGQEDSRANARLIAAAPELLEALKELVEWAMDAATELDIPTHSPSCISKARAAIAKAEGR